jgi:hypothetical protein
LQDFFNTLFNDNLISRDTNHYKLINLLKCSEDSYSNDNLFIFINEYLIIGMSRILYIIVGVIFVYLFVIIILFVYYNVILEEDYVISYGIDYTFIKISIFIFLFIIIQISLFTVIFNTYIINIYDNINIENQSINEYVFSNIPSSKDFYEILKKDINDNITINGYIINTTNKENLSKNLLLYDLYFYFNSYINSSDPNNEIIDEYLKNQNKDVSFYDLMNVKVILPVQKYHEKLDFLNSGSAHTSDIETNISNQINKINDNLDKINKYIIDKNNTTILPIYYILIYCFLMVCLMIFTIIGLIYIIAKGESKFFIEKIFYINHIKVFFTYLLKKIKIIEEIKL